MENTRLRELAGITTLKEGNTPINTPKEVAIRANKNLAKSANAAFKRGIADMRKGINHSLLAAQYMGNSKAASKFESVGNKFENMIEDFDQAHMLLDSTPLKEAKEENDA